MLLECIANRILLLFYPLRFTSLFWREDLKVEEISKEPAGRWTRIILPNLRTQSLSGPHWEEGGWKVSFEVPCPRLEDCREAPDEWDARLHLLHFILRPCCRTQPHLCLMGSRCLTLQWEGIQNYGIEDPDTLSLLFPLKKQIEEGKLHHVMILQEDLTTTGWNQSHVLRICVIQKEKTKQYALKWSSANWIVLSIFLYQVLLLLFP